MFICSKSFDNNGMIPQKHTGFGEDISPEFIITDQPANTVSIAISLDDLDVPFCKSFNHWIAWNIPNTEIIPEGLPKGAIIQKPIYVCQGVAWGKNCYRGPKQPFFIRNIHRYVFTFYALDCQLKLSNAADKKALVDAMQGHILAEAKIVGKYKRG